MILLDGAMGTELQRRGADLSPPLWSARALIEAPELVREIHEDYLRAGAQVITTNSFRTHARNLAEGGIGERARELTTLAVTLARQARDRVGVEAKIAGSISPLLDCWRPQDSPGSAAALEHRAMAETLAEAGCDLFLIETMGRVDEAVAAVTATAGFERPIWLAVTCRADGNLLGGESFVALAEALRGAQLAALLVNCTDLARVPAALPGLLAAGERLAIPVGLYPHTGESQPDGFVPHALDLDTFAERLCALASPHPAIEILGSCCGSTPDWTAALVRRIHRSREDRDAGLRRLTEMLAAAN